MGSPRGHRARAGNHRGGSDLPRVYFVTLFFLPAPRTGKPESWAFRGPPPLSRKSAYAALCCAVLRCAALRCAALRCAALRCAVLCCAVLCCAVLRYATLRYAMLCCSLCTVYRVPSPVYCLLCTVYRVPCTVYRVPCTVYCVPCTMYCVPCTVLGFHARWISPADGSRRRAPARAPLRRARTPRSQRSGRLFAEGQRSSQRLLLLSLIIISYMLTILNYRGSSSVTLAQPPPGRVLVVRGWTFSPSRRNRPESRPLEVLGGENGFPSGIIR